MQPGMPAAVTLTAYPDQPITGRVETIGCGRKSGAFGYMLFRQSPYFPACSFSSPFFVISPYRPMARVYKI